MHLAQPRVRGKALAARTAIIRALSVITAPFATAHRLLPRRRILALAGSFSLLAAAFASGIVGPVSAANASSHICLTYDTSYCMAYVPNLLTSTQYDIYGVAPSQCSSLSNGNDCSWNLVYEGNWSADGVVGSEYELQAAANTRYCLAGTVIEDLSGNSPQFAPCGANGTVWVADSNDAAGEYLISRYELNNNPPAGLSSASIIIVQNPTSGATPAIGFVHQTGGATFGRWNF